MIEIKVRSRQSAVGSQKQPVTEVELAYLHESNCLLQTAYCLLFLHTACIVYQMTL